MLLAEDWKDYRLLDSGNGEKLEAWGGYTVVRPDPQAIWPRGTADWQGAHAVYKRSSSGGGQWLDASRLPESWEVRYGALRFLIRPTDFKHMGLFPEQAVNWDWMAERIRTAGRPVSVLNLFGYTGGATVACVAAGAAVCHLDAAKGMVRWAGDNIRANGLGEREVRYIVDDARAFVARERRRGKQYDAVVMDPPSYGRGAQGEPWKIEHDLFPLVREAATLLSSTPLFFVINSYTAGFSPTVLANILQLVLQKPLGGTITRDELGLAPAGGGPVLPCGIVARWKP